MKIIVISVVIGIVLINAVMCYCLIRTGKEEDKWMENHPLSGERDNGKNNGRSEDL